MNDSIKKTVEALKNPIIAFVVTFVSMLLVGIILPSYWIFLFAAVWSYVLSDIFLNAFIVGGGGIAQIPITRDHLTKHKGHAYTAFFVGIIISTVAAGVISDLILQFIKATDEWLTNVLGWSLFACLAVFGDLEARFYKRD
jgi:MFS family permease